MITPLSWLQFCYKSTVIDADHCVITLTTAITTDSVNLIQIIIGQSYGEGRIECEQCSYTLQWTKFSHTPSPPRRRVIGTTTCALSPHESPF